MYQRVAKIIPALSQNLYKGQLGKVGVVGGCLEYTGAPYYAAHSALKSGADLAFIFCDESAATAIKSYSPEIIVTPFIDLRKYSFPSATCKEQISELKISDGSEDFVTQAVQKVSEVLPRLSALVIGPGLGRHPLMLNAAARIIKKAKELRLPIVVDGDALFLINFFPSIIHGYPLAVLTPNGMEYRRLCHYLDLESGRSMNECELLSASDLSAKLGNVTIVRKGAIDTISNGHETLICDEPGSARRCGGQGDILAGSTGTFLSWAMMQRKANEDSHPPPVDDNEVTLSGVDVLSAALGACVLTRASNLIAFERHKRATTSVEMVAVVGEAFEKRWPATAQ